MRTINPKTLMADGEYELSKLEATRIGHPTRVSIPIIEKRIGLKPRQLANYRANYYSRRSR